MGDNLSTLVFWLIIGLIAVIGGWLKTRREAKEREERERRKIEARVSTEPKPGAPAPPIVMEESRPAEEPDASPSPLEEFRRMVREAQDREKRRREGLEPPPPPPVMQAPPPPPIPRAAPAPRLVPTLQVKAEKVDIPITQTKVERMFSDRDKVETARLASKGPSGAAPTLAVPAPDPEAELVAVRLSDIYESDRSDIAKAVILREVLGPPVAYRHRVIPPVRS